MLDINLNPDSYFDLQVKFTIKLTLKINSAMSSNLRFPHICIHLNILQKYVSKFVKFSILKLAIRLRYIIKHEIHCSLETFAELLKNSIILMLKKLQKPKAKRINTSFFVQKV